MPNNVAPITDLELFPDNSLLKYFCFTKACNIPATKKPKSRYNDISDVMVNNDVINSFILIFVAKLICVER